MLQQPAGSRDRTRLAALNEHFPHRLEDESSPGSKRVRTFLNASKMVGRARQGEDRGAPNLAIQFTRAAAKSNKNLYRRWKLPFQIYHTGYSIITMDLVSRFRNVPAAVRDAHRLEPEDTIPRSPQDYSMNSEEQRAHWDLKCEHGQPSLTEPDPCFISAISRLMRSLWVNPSPTQAWHWIWRAAQSRHLLTVVASNPGIPSLCLGLSQPQDVAPGFANLRTVSGK